MILAGDVGGTNTRLALFSHARGPHEPVTSARFANADFVSLEEILRAFVRDQDAPPERAAIGVAGPVRAGRVQITNLPWTIDETQVSAQLDGAPVRLLNDLEAIANAIPVLVESDSETLHSGQAVARAPIAVIAPGTGLGEAYLTWADGRYRAYASEGGHTDFAPTNELELELLQFLLPRIGRVSYERVCSGSGLPNLYAFFREAQQLEEPNWLRAELAAAADAAPVIVDAALENKAEICVATLELFVAILGSEAGNLALQALAGGGVYIGGGIAPRILTALRERRFMAAFTNKGRFADLMQQIPVHVILNSNAALIGAANVARG